MKQLKKDILEYLQALKGSGRFASVHTADFLFPGLEVEGVGEIAYPVNKLQAEALIKVAHKAPFGKGHQTILDDKVRSGREIDADKLRFNSPSWDKFLNKAITNIKADLGLEDYSIEAHIYKLLIYEEGDFFLPHQDSEKEKGMFGTLIIGLPSQYTGGELVIRFEGGEEVADFSGTDMRHSINYTAFYADCEHEVKPLTSGYRICLVYNLVQQKTGKKIELKPLQSHVDKLVGIFTNNNRNNSRPYIILLGHQYTPENFSENTLKLNDRVRAKALLQAAEQAGCYAKLCLVTSYLSGSPADDSYGYDEYGDDDDNAEMGEVYDNSLSIEKWISNDFPEFNRIGFEEEELITSFPLSEGEPIVKESTGYMGNYGPDVMYWYHYGAVMIWTPEVNAQLLLSQNTETQLNWIGHFNRVNLISDAEAAAVKTILLTGLDSRYHPNEKENFNVVADWMINRNEKTFFVRLNTERLQFFFEQIDTAHWIKLFKFLPAEVTEKTLEKVSETITTSVLEKLLTVLRAMDDDKELSLIAEGQIELLPRHISSLYANDSQGINAKALFCLFGLVHTPAATKEWTKTIAEILTEKLNRAYVHNTLAKELLSAKTKSELTERLLLSCRDYLQQRVDNKPQPPEDWSRPVPNTRYYRIQWQILKPFLESPDETVFDFRKRQSERDELESAIKDVVIDLKTETIRKGSPHTLRITKTQAAYKRAMKDWHADVELLEKMS